jgi:hypothetical protein
MSQAAQDRRPVSLGLRLIGEFSVIVLGVLVALGVEGWYADRQEATREVELLESLASDLETSLAALEEDNAFTLGRVESLDWFLRFPVASGAPFPADSIGRVTMAANWTESYYPTLRTYETMIATGTFDLISSTDIRLALADVKSESQNYSDYRNQATQQWNDMFAMTWLQFMGVHRIPGGGVSPEPVPGSPPATSVEDALTDDLFRAVVDRRRIFLWYVVDGGNELAEAMNTALDLITEELTAR